MVRKLLALFRKNKAEETKPLNTSFINDVEEILKITCPMIEDVACIFSAYDVVKGKLMDVAVRENDFDEDYIPANVPSMNGYYLDEQNTILLAGKYRDSDYVNMKSHYTDLTGSEKLFFLIHELRHVWQKDYAADIYYKKNAINSECIDDIAEVDADAFALSYFFSERTPFTFKHTSTIAEDLALQATLDKGKRWKRVEELSREYGFNNHKKLEAFKKHIDWNKVNLMIKLLTLQGKI